MNGLPDSGALPDDTTVSVSICVTGCANDSFSGYISPAAADFAGPRLVSRIFSGNQPRDSTRRLNMDVSAVFSRYDFI